jgi:hypothetical protein
MQRTQPLCKSNFVLAAWLIGTVSFGCTSRARDPKVNPEESSNLSTIDFAYDRATKELGRPPANAEELKPYLKEVGDPDAILVSPRDGRPYVIIWGVNFRKVPIKSMPPPILVYEEQGLNGKRYVLTPMGVMSVSDKQFATAEFAQP